MDPELDALKNELDLLTSAEDMQQQSLGDVVNQIVKLSSVRDVLAATLNTVRGRCRWLENRIKEIEESSPELPFPPEPGFAEDPRARVMEDDG